MFSIIDNSKILMLVYILLKPDHTETFRHREPSTAHVLIRNDTISISCFIGFLKFTGFAGRKTVKFILDSEDAICMLLNCLPLPFFTKLPGKLELHSRSCRFFYFEYMQNKKFESDDDDIGFTFGLTIGTLAAEKLKTNQRLLNLTTLC